MEKPNLKLRRFCRVTLFKELSRIQKVYKKKQNLNHPYSSALHPVTEKDKVLCCDASLRRRKPKVDIMLDSYLTLFSSNRFRLPNLNTEFTFSEENPQNCFKIKAKQCH